MVILGLDQSLTMSEPAYRYQVVGRECRRGAGSVFAPPGRTRVGRWATGSSRAVAVGSRPGERGHPQPQTAGDRPASPHFVTAILPPGKVREMSRIDPDLLSEFSVITEEAAEYRRHSFGARSREKQFNDEGRSYFYLLSRHLSVIHRMVRRHPELQVQYQEWLCRYPTFTSD